MNLRTISFLKKNAANLSLEDPLIITKNGKPIYVIESIHDRYKRDETIALLKLVIFAKSDMQAGRIISSNSFNKSLLQRKLYLIENSTSE